MRLRSPRLGTFLVPLLALSTFTPVIAQDTPRRPPTSETVKDTERTPLTPEERRAKARERAVSRVWWNQQKKLTKLDLSAETRKKMDAMLLDFLIRRSEMMDQRQVDDFAAALERSDFEAAKKASKAQTELNASGIQAQMDLMIEVARLLTPDQLKTIAENYPMLFRRDWVPNRGMMNRRPGERGNMAGEQRRDG